MSMRLDQLITTAREQGPRDLDDVWDLDRSERVRTGALRRRDARTRRHRVLRRGLLVASGAGLLVLALLRGASSAPAEPQVASTVASPLAPQVSPQVPSAEALASRTLADAGYARD